MTPSGHRLGAALRSVAAQLHTNGVSAGRCSLEKNHGLATRRSAP